MIQFEVLGIDPGPKTSGICYFDGARVLSYDDAMDNERVCDEIANNMSGCLVSIERPRYMGAVDARLIDTAEWCGRLYERARVMTRKPALYTFHEVRCHFGLPYGNETGVRVAMKAHFDAKPIPLKYVHAWSALALAMVYTARHPTELSRAGP